MENKKEKLEISTVLMVVFLLIGVLIGGAIYMLPSYYFINPDLEFGSSKTIENAIISKNKKLKTPDFSIFDGGKFISLKKGYWHVFDKKDIKIGNKEPFDSVLLLEKKKQYEQEELK